ncbi:MAG: hypothetical protein ACYC1M_08965 [Armatimonadota bacterium]
MFRNPASKPSPATLEQIADQLLKSTPDHNALTEQQMRRRRRQERESLNKYVCQSDPTLDAMNYLKHQELMLVITGARLNTRQKRMVMLLLQDISVQEAGAQIGIKRSCAYELYHQVVSRLREVWLNAPVTGLASSYCRDINRRYARKSCFRHRDHEPGDSSGDV